MDKEQISVVLMGRHYLYNLFHLIFGREPTKELLDAAFCEATKEALEIFLSKENASLQAAYDAYISFGATYEQHEDVSLEKAKLQHTKHFVGPLELEAPPWECVYLNGIKVLFQESTLAVRDAYRSEGFLPAQYPHVSDDHISLELDFMNLLSQKCSEQFEQEYREEYYRLLNVQNSFLLEHLLKWVPAYVSDLCAAAQGSLYDVFGKLVVYFLHVDQEIVAELVEI